MGFSKIDYKSSEAIFEVKISEDSGVIGKWKFKKSDFPKWVNIISKKMGINMNRDLDWAL